MEQRHYSLMAAASLAAASISPALGQIQYTDLDPDASFLVDNSYTNVLDLDLDGDGSADLQFSSTGLSYGFALEAKAVNPDWKFAGGLFYSFINSCSAYYVRGASVSFPIGGIGSFRSSANFFINTFPCGDITNWGQGEVKYMGLRKEDGGDFYYGWLRIERRPDVGFDELYIFRDHALNLTPNATIPAGDAGGICLTPGNLSAVVSGSSVTVSWEEIYNADGYQVEGRRIGSPLVKSKVTAGTSLTIPFINPGDYAWKVRTGCLPDLSDFSAEDSFTVPVLRLSENPEQVELTLTPNPATAETVLQLSGFSGEVQVELYNLLGQPVMRQTVDADQDHTITLGTARLSPGNYLASVQSQSVRSTTLLIIH